MFFIHNDTYTHIHTAHFSFSSAKVTAWRDTVSNKSMTQHLARPPSLKSLTHRWQFAHTHKHIQFVSPIKSNCYTQKITKEYQLLE